MLNRALPSKPSPEVLAEHERRLREHELREKQRAEADRLAQIERLWAISGVMPLHREGLIHGADDDGPWVDRLRKLSNTLAAEEPEPRIYALVGIRGNGKTQMAACLVRQYCEQRKPARYIVAACLFREIRACFRQNGPDEREMIESFVKPDFLVIDELHERKGSDHENAALTNIIDLRYGAMKATMLISNETRQEFAEGIGPSIISRMRECGEAIECNWPSFRTK